MNAATDTEGDPAPILSKQELRLRIEALAISADAKAILLDIATVTATVGGKLVAVGQRILSFAFDIVRSFPNTTFGLIVGYVLTALVASVPWIGALLGAMLGPLLIAMGIGAGALSDLKQRAFVARVERLEKDMVALAAKPA